MYVIYSLGDPDEKFREASKDVIEGQFRRGYEFLKDRDDVPESVKTLFRLENSRRIDITSFIRRKRNQEFMRHPLDNKSHEVLIANYTSKIRHLQELIRYDNPYMSISRIMCNHFKNKRNKRLNELSRMDQGRYKAVVAKLGLKHQPSQAGVIDDLPVVRNDSLRQLTREYCDNIRRERLTAYHDKLKALQKPFLEEKKRTLEWIQKEMEKYNINEEDVSTEFRIRDKYRDLPVKRTPVSV